MGKSAEEFTNSSGRQHRKRRTSIRRKAFTSLSIAYVVLIAYFFYFAVVKQHYAAEDELLSEARMKASLVSTAISEYVLRKDETFLKDLIENALKDRELEYIRILDKKGDVIAEGGKLNVFPADKDSVRHRGDNMSLTIVQEIGQGEGFLHGAGHIFDIYMPVAYKGKTIGGLQLGVNTRRANRRLENIAYLGITFTALIILTGILLGCFLDRRLRGALKKLIQTTERMAGGDLTRRVSIDTGDELEELGGSFNRMAQALSEREKELITARRTMISMFNGITAGIAYISREYEIIYANHAYNELVTNVGGSSNNKHKCYELVWCRELPCEDCSGLFAMERGVSCDIQKDIIFENGEKHILWIHAYPVQDQENNTIGFVEYILDITDQRKMENELKHYTEHLEEIVQERTSSLKEAQVQIVHQEKMAALGQMAAGVAHEIGNPLAALSSLLRNLESALVVQSSTVSVNDSITEKTGVMKEQIDRISRIVREMMDFSRPAEYRKSLTHVNQVIRSALGISKYDKRLKNVRVNTSLDSEIPALKLDGDQLLQACLNIIFNAGDAMNGEGVLSVTSMYEGGYIRIVFEDTGSGIAEDQLPHLFEPFFTTKDVGEGTGLGLYVSYGIMQNLGGTIWASNRQGGGSVFTMKIPTGK